MQRAYLLALTELAEADKRLVSIIADNGTGFEEIFKSEFPEQFFDFGIAEANMVAAAAGMASCGKIPFVYTAGAFLAYRAYEFVRDDVCLQRQNVKLVGNGAGLSISTLGPTHHTTEDIGALRALPRLTVLCPASPREAGVCVRAAHAIDGPVYIRLGMGGEPELYPGDYSFTLGKGVTMAEGDDAAILATGSIVGQAMEAATALRQAGINVRVVNLHTLKPLDEEIILKAARETKALFTVEEHNIIGGLGSAVAEVLATAGCAAKLHRIGLEDRFATGYGSLDAVRRQNGLDAGAIAEKVRCSL